tara:strand:+ start:857 stop:1273 length:417 start_codon:yes stop_codon:yes gene_type:complete
MAHFAKLDENNKVIAVHVVNNENVLDSSGNESENVGISFLKNIWGQETNWVQTSYNANFRKQFAGKGDTYSSELNVFIRPKPFESWVLNSNHNWEAPTSAPELTAQEISDRKGYVWNESNYQVDNSTGWELFTYPAMD